MKIPFCTIADVDRLVFATGLAYSEGTKKTPPKRGLVLCICQRVKGQAPKFLFSFAS